MNPERAEPDVRESNPAPHHPHAPRLLLVDDSPVERMALAHYLRRQGYNVDEAGDGQSALDHLKNQEVNAILLDLQMPGGMDGFDVLKYLQQHRHALTVVLLS